MDHLGSHFWSQPVAVPDSLAETFVIDHQASTVLVQGSFQGSPAPLPGLNVYLFTSAGAHVGLHEMTDEAGRVVFHLPDADYRVRADYLGGQFWSPDFRRTDAAIVIPHGRAEIRVHRSGAPLNGARVYLFKEDGAYLGRYETTNAEGSSAFLLPVAAYRLRVDEEGRQHWTPTVPIAPDQLVPIEVDIATD